MPTIKITYSDRKVNHLLQNYYEKLNTIVKINFENIIDNVRNMMYNQVNKSRKERWL